MIKETLQSKWQVWKQHFCETYANKGWSVTKYALSFKYQSGSLLDYAKKRKTVAQNEKNHGSRHFN